MVHSLHLYTFATWKIAPPTAPFGSIIDLRRYINYVVIRVFSSQNLRRAGSWGTSSTILIGGPIVVAQSKPWFRRHTGRAICKLGAPAHSIMEQTCEDGGGCSGRRSNAKPAAASRKGGPAAHPVRRNDQWAGQQAGTTRDKFARDPAGCRLQSVDRGQTGEVVGTLITSKRISRNCASRARGAATLSPAEEHAAQFCAIA
jgi:hypothetical protein